jgi:hypothetical protein
MSGVDVAGLLSHKPGALRIQDERFVLLSSLARARRFVHGVDN